MDDYLIFKNLLKNSKKSSLYFFLKEQHLTDKNIVVLLILKSKCPD